MDLLDAPTDSSARAGPVPTVCDGLNSGGRARGWRQSLGPRQLRLSPAAQELASIQTAPVERRFAPVETRMVGKIAVDETQVRSIAAWVAGRIDRLYVDYTGVRVEKGDHIAYLYSPELLTAQEELIQALRARTRLVDSGTSVGQTAQATVEAAREKLRLLGLKEEQIRARRARAPSLRSPDDLRSNRRRGDRKAP